VAPFAGDIGINLSRTLARGPGPRRLELSARIADIGDLRVYGALEDIDATGLTVAPAFDDQAAEGDLVRLPDWSAWRGATVSVGQPGALFLLAPSSSPPAASAATSPSVSTDTTSLSENWRLVRRLGPTRARP
jgi:hypothetical protein